MAQWEKDRYNPLQWERDLSIAVFVRAVRDCVDLNSSYRAAYDAYHFLMDDVPWEVAGISCNCRDMIRDAIEDPAKIPTEEGYVQEVMDIFRDP